MATCYVEDPEAPWQTYVRARDLTTCLLKWEYKQIGSKRYAVFHDAGHLSVRAEHVEVLSKRVSIGEELPGHALANDGYWPLLQGVRLVQSATRKKRDSHCLEESWANGIDAEIIRCDVDASERHIRKRGHRLHSRKCRKALV